MTLLNQSAIIYTGNVDATCYYCVFNGATNQWLCIDAPTPEMLELFIIIMFIITVLVHEAGKISRE